MSTAFLATKAFNNVSNDRYIVIYNYDSKTSNQINSSLDSQSLWFSDDGVIRMKCNSTCSEGTNINLITENGISYALIPNLITKQTNVPAVNTYLIKPSLNSQKFFFSKPYGNYILFKKSADEIKLLHNPIPRIEFANFYNSTPTNRKLAFDTAINMCTDTNQEDPVCKCLNKEQIKSSDPNTEFCVDRLLGTHDATQSMKQARQAYETLSQYCGCSDPDCREHPFSMVYRNPQGENKCPDGEITITACVAGMSATNLTTAGVNINQNCGPEKSKTTTTSHNTEGQGTSTTPSDTTSTSSEKKIQSEHATPSDTTDKSSSSNVMFWVIIGVSIVMLIGLIIFFMKN